MTERFGHRRTLPRPEPPQLPRVYYPVAALLGAVLGLVAFLIAPHGPLARESTVPSGGRSALLFVGGGLLFGLLLVAVVRLGIRLQRRDLPPSGDDVQPLDTMLHTKSD
jgi:hypothetical protein